MKITIKKRGQPLYVYHHPREVTYDEESKMITIGSTEPMTYHIKEVPQLGLAKCENSTFSEIFMEFEIVESDKEINEKFESE